MIGAIGSGLTVTDAFAYDAYGNVVASVTSSLPTPWRYQGRMLESAAGTPDLYDFSARSYSPTTGTFTSLDTVHGSAMNPALLNGYVYANANPETLVDPDGHSAQSCWEDGDCSSGDRSARHSTGNSTTGQHEIATANEEIAARCPVRYCGTSSQKEADIWATGNSYEVMQGLVADAAAAKTDGMTDAQIEAQMSVDFQNSCYAGDTPDPTVPCPPKLDPEHPEDWPSLDQYRALGGDVADYYHEVYQAAYDKTYSAMIDEGFSKRQARDAATNLANINVGSDSGVFADRLSRGFSYLGMIYDTAKTIRECHNESADDCAWAAAKTLFLDYASYKTIAIAEEACVAGEVMGPEGCAASAAVAGLLLDPDFWQVVIAGMQSPWWKQCEDSFGDDLEQGNTLCDF